MDTTDRFRGCLVGLAVGDAVGTTVEFQRRGTFPPVTDMVGGGPFRLRPGEWTDDTSMALCLATSLLEKGFDPRDQLERYCDWWKNGTLSSNGWCFDIGNTVRDALSRYRETGEPLSGSTHPRSAGNGSIMRLAPVPMYYFPNKRLAVEQSGESSRTTHGAAECIDACRFLGLVLLRALRGAAKEEILAEPASDILSAEAIREIARGRYRSKNADEIEGLGYVVRSLEAALWCFWKAHSFEESVLLAANLGDDADTTAAVCGQVAGAHYGESGIPVRWRERLVKGREIRSLADRFHTALTVRTAITGQQTGVDVSRWTDRAKRVLTLAGEAMHVRRDSEIDSLHLLLGMVRERYGVAGNVLYNMGVDLPWLKEKVNMLLPAGTAAANSVGPLRRLDLDSVITQAHGAAKQLGHNYVGTEHLLLGIARVPDCAAARLLRNLGIEPHAVGREVVALLASA